MNMYLTTKGTWSKGKEDLLCWMKRSLFEEKQALRQLYMKLDKFMLDSSFSRCNSNHHVYLQSSRMVTLLFLLMEGLSIKKVNDIKKILAKRFSIKYLCKAWQLLGMQITPYKKARNCGCLREDIARRCWRNLIWRMQNRWPQLLVVSLSFQRSMVQRRKRRRDTWRNLYIYIYIYSFVIRSLLYLMVSMRSDIAHDVEVVSRIFMKCPRKEY